MTTYAIGPCSCGHTITVEASSEEEALEQGLSNFQSHLDEYHADDPQLAELEAMSMEERAEMMRPLVHIAAPSESMEPAFREKLKEE